MSDVAKENKTITGYKLLNDDVLATLQIEEGDYGAVTDKVINAETAAYQFQRAKITALHNLKTEEDVDSGNYDSLSYKIGDTMNYSYKYYVFYMDEQIIIDNYNFLSNIKNYTGSIIRYYNNGAKRAIFNYKNCKKDGLYQKFDKDGKLIKELHYKDGKEIKEVTAQEPPNNQPSANELQEKLLEENKTLKSIHQLYAENNDLKLKIIEEARKTAKLDAELAALFKLE